MRRALLLLTLLASLTLIAAACGGDDEGTDAGDGDAAGTQVVLVTDIGGLNDRGFNALANEGLKRSETELDVDGRVLISDSAADYVPNLSTAARTGAGLVVANGFLMGDALADVAGSFPDTNFAIIDFPWDALEGGPENALGLIFAEEEAGYLAGIAAARASETGTVSAVGGVAVPAVVAFLAGYEAGAKAENPDIEVLTGFSQDFVDQAKCKELALNQIQAGSDVVFAAAGGCGLGALQAAREREIWGIGVDNDQAFLGSHILTSATKKVDVAVFETAKLVADGEFAGGQSTLFDLSNGGVGYGEVSEDAPDRDALIERLDEVSDQIANGEIDPPRE